MVDCREFQKAMWEVIKDNEWMLVTNQNVDWLIEQTYKKLMIAEQTNKNLGLD